MAVTVAEPAVFKVTENVPVPAVSAAFDGSVALASVLVIEDDDAVVAEGFGEDARTGIGGASIDADDCIGISVLDCLHCDGTGTVRLDPGYRYAKTEPLQGEPGVAGKAGVFGWQSFSLQTPSPSVSLIQVPSQFKYDCAG